MSIKITLNTKMGTSDFMHSTVYTCSLALHVEKVMTIVLLCESAQQFRALLMIYDTEHDISRMLPMPYMPLFRVSETSISQVLSPVLF